MINLKNNKKIKNILINIFLLYYILYLLILNIYYKKNKEISNLILIYTLI